MKSVLISIQPKWCKLIASGKKTIEVRKSAPKEVPFKAYIYCTKKGMAIFGDSTCFVTDIMGVFKSRIKMQEGFELASTLKKWNGEIIGEFICDKIYKIEPDGEYYTYGYDIDDDSIEEMCLTREDLTAYGKGKPIYAWHISDLKIYDKPKELGEIVKSCDWNYDCCTCRRAVYELTKAEAKVFYGCDREITRPPQSWQYVEEL